MRLIPLHLLAAAALAAPLAAQQTDYRFTLDPNQSLVNWNVTSSLGTIVVNPSTFKMAGALEVRLDAPSSPTSGEILDGFLFTQPGTLSGSIPNPLPFLPPLGAFTVNNLQATIAAPSFPVSPAGAVNLTATLTTTAGTITTSGLIGSGTEPLYGIPSSPTPTTATLTQVGSTLVAEVDIDITLSLAITGGTVDVTLQGTLHAEADLANAGPMRLAAPRPLTPGGPAVFTVEHAPTGQPVFLGASLVGLGATPVAPLGVVVNLANPIQAGGPKLAAPNGTVSFSANVPASVSGRSVLLQAVTSGEVSNLAGTWVL